ncbi:MAG: glycosyltransferase family 4 protein [Candidatus Omnitrophota bacterium]
MGEQRKTILHIVKLNPKKLGSFEEYIIALHREILSRGLRGIIIFESEVPPSLRDRYNGIEIKTLSQKEGFFSFYFKLFRFIKEYKPDIVHIAFHPIFSEISFLVYLFGARNIIFSDRISGEIKRKKFIKRKFSFIKNKFINQFIRKIICVSDYVQNRDSFIPGIDRTKLVTILNGVNLKRFDSSGVSRQDIRQQFKIGESAFLVTNISHLVKVKGIDVIVKAAKAINIKYKDIIFLIVGVGKDEEKIKSMVNEFSLEGVVQFAGLRNDTENILAASDMFVYPSVWQEACGFGIIEALACGLPVITTQVGGTPELIMDGFNGFLIESNSSEALAKKIEYLYLNRDFLKKMGECAKKDARKRLDLNRVVSQVMDVYARYL